VSPLQRLMLSSVDLLRNMVMFVQRINSLSLNFISQKRVVWRNYHITVIICFIHTQHSTYAATRQTQVIIGYLWMQRFASKMQFPASRLTLDQISAKIMPPFFIYCAHTWTLAYNNSDLSSLLIVRYSPCTLMWKKPDKYASTASHMLQVLWGQECCMQCMITKSIMHNVHIHTKQQMQKGIAHSSPHGQLFLFQYCYISYPLTHCRNHTERWRGNCW